MKRCHGMVLFIAILLFVYCNLIAIAIEQPEPVTGPITVAQIVEKYIQACGNSRLLEIKTETREGTLVRGVTGKVPVKIVAKVPGKWYCNQTFAWGDQVSFGYDGINAWVQDTKSIEKMEAHQLLDFQLMLDAQAPLKIKELYPEMTIIGPEQVGDRGATTVLAKSGNGISTELAFDAETGLLLRAGAIYFEDYRDVSAVKRPFTILLGRDEGEAQLQMKMQFTNIQHNLEVDDAWFEWPNCVLTMKEAPLYKKRQQVEISIESLEACVGVYQSTERPEVTYTVTRQQNHLMIEGTGWGQKFEIKPESETDYFIKFLGVEFHFIKDASGKVLHLEIGDRRLKAVKLDQKF